MSIGISRMPCRALYGYLYHFSKMKKYVLFSHLVFLIAYGINHNLRYGAEQYYSQDIAQHFIHIQISVKQFGLKGKVLFQTKNKHSLIRSCKACIDMLQESVKQYISQYNRNLTRRKQVTYGLNSIGKLRNGDISSNHKP